MVTDSISRLVRNRNKSILLYGVPGTEKIRIAMHAASSILNVNVTRIMRYRFDPVGITSDNGCWEILYMHPGCDYPGFVGARREKSPGVGNNNNFRRGIFSLICKKATEMRDLHGRNDNSRNFVLILDSIEKVNLPDILGELLPALSFRDIPVSTTFTRSISVPDNLHIIATANVASPRLLPQFSELARYFAPVNITPDISRLPLILAGYGIEEGGISSYTDKCKQLNATLAKIVSESLHIENVGIGQEFLAKIKDYMNHPGSRKEDSNTIDKNMLETMWNDIIDPLIFEMLGNTYYRAQAKLDAAKSHFIK